MTYVSYKACTPSIQPKNWSISDCICLFMYFSMISFSTLPWPCLLPIPFADYSPFGSYYSLVSVKFFYYECICAQMTCLVLLRDICLLCFGIVSFPLQHYIYNIYHVVTYTIVYSFLLEYSIQWCSIFSK